MQRLAGLVVSTIAILGALSPVAVLAKAKPSADSKDLHDCRQFRGKHGSACDLEPQTRRTFALHQPIMGAVRYSSATPAQISRAQGSVTRLGKVRPVAR